MLFLTSIKKVIVNYKYAIEELSREKIYIIAFMESKIAKLRRILEKEKLEALLISNFYNIIYTSGFKTLSPSEREGFILVSDKNTYLFTDGRYFNEELKIINSKSKIITKLIGQGENIASHLKEALISEKVKRLGFESEDLTFSEYKIFKEALFETDLIPTKRLIINLRSTKDAEEIKIIKQAFDLTDRCFQEILPKVHAGQSEKEVALMMERWVKEKGCSLAFDPIIVAVDKNAALPHYNTQDGDGVIQEGSVVLIDFGLKYNNYLSDITRMVFVGKPNDEIVSTYDKLLEAQEKTVAYLGSTNNPQEVDDHCRKQLKQSGLPNYAHSTGHGVGLEIHEFPKISPASVDKIVDNQVFTVEPGVYIEGKWGMRIEDTILMRDGKPEILTKFPKTPFKS